MSLSGSERSSQSCEQLRQSRSGTRQRKLFRKRDKRSRSSERYEFSDLEDDIFVRGPRKLRREDVEGELSYDYTNPGHLKVFTAGLNRCAGLPEFRTVLVSATATAGDVINEVLQRCDVLYSDGDEFFLCEVIGKLEPYQSQQLLHHHHHHGEATHFVEQCRRIIGPEEHVLVIQALWKPLFGYFRRFELKQMSRDESRVVRRRRRPCLRLWRSGGSDFFRHNDINGSESVGEFVSADRLDSDSGDDESFGHKKQKASSGHRCQAATQVEPGDPPTLARGRTRGFGTQTETVYFASADRRLRKKYSVPLGPYLLLLKGFDSRHDLLVNDLFDVNLLGSDDQRCDVHLRCADVLPEHCIVEACHSELDGDSGTSGRTVKPYCMSVAPIGGGEVLLNGQLIDRKHFMSPGDVISIGAGEMCSYVFMFKDASQVPDRSIGLAWLMFLESAQRSIDIQQLLEGSGAEVGQQPARPAAAAAAVGSFVSTTVPSDSVLDTPRGGDDVSATDGAQETDAQQLAQASLGSLLALYFGEAIDLQFAAGLLVLLAVYVTDLELERASAEIQWHITDSVVTLSKKASQMQDLRDKAQCYGEMIQACALAFEIFLFFHEVCGSGLTAAAVRCQQWRDFCETTMQQMLDNIFSQLGEEVLAQGAALCDTGLGCAGKGNSEPEPSMESFITLLTQVSQAFANAQYQCVSTLRLMIMKRLVFQVAKTFTQRLFSEDPAVFLKWNCAVQLRVNLDQLEEWLRQEGLERFLAALDLPNSLVDLVATPKSHLVTMSWQALRTAFPLIPPSLLRCTLAEYESRSGPVSGIWRVSTEDRNEAGYNVTCAIEDHFQLAIEECLIPVEEVKPSVQLRRLLDDTGFNELMRHLDQQTGASNCRLQWRHVASRIRGRLLSPLDCQPEQPLGRLFSQSAAPSAAASAVAAASAAASVVAATADADEVDNAEILFYDSLSEGDNGDGEKTPVEMRLLDEELPPATPMSLDVGIAAAVSADGIVSVVVQRTPAPNQQAQRERQQKQQRPKTPTPANPFALLAPATDGEDDGDGDEEESSLVDSFTLANTLRNEIHAHRVNSDTEGEAEGDIKAGGSRRPVCLLGFRPNGDAGSEGNDESDSWGDSGAAADADSSTVTEALYQQHTRSFVAPTPSPPPAPPTHQPPPPPPPRSWSLNGRRTHIERLPPPRGLTEKDEDEGSTSSDVSVVTLTRSPGQSFGMELIDGEKASLATQGVFIRSVVADTPAGSSRRLVPGDRIIAVNGQSLTKLPYAKCLGLIKRSETVLHLLVARSSSEVAARVLATAC